MPPEPDFLASRPQNFSFSGRGPTLIDTSFGIKLKGKPDTKALFYDMLVQVRGTARRRDRKPGQIGVVVKLNGKRLCEASTNLGDFPERDGFTFTGILTRQISTSLKDVRLTVESLNSDTLFDSFDSIHVSISVISAAQSK